MAILDLARAPTAVGRLIERIREPVEAELARRLSFRVSGPAGESLAQGQGDPPARLFEAMRYAALSPGKRLRPALAIAACEAVGGSLAQALPVAAAIELVHAYTLVHDDMPALDNDEMRRGRPTVHVAYGEANALLAGDGLLTAAFAALADLDARAAAAVAVLGARAGAEELLAGQALDLAGEGKEGELSLFEVERIHAGKTGALFAAATEMGGIAAGAKAGARAALARYGLCIGIAFQHADDHDDEEFAHLGAAALRRRHELCEEAASLARGLEGGGGDLVALAEWIGRA
jgi:geranylgeranyl pyrophosphate synthase